MNIADCQPELALRVQAARTVCADSVNELCGLLAGRDWVTARELSRLRPEWSERFIRALAEASNAEKGKIRVISGPGTPGYRLATREALDEIEHAGRASISQGRKMAHRGIKFLRWVADVRRTDAVISAANP